MLKNGTQMELKTTQGNRVLFFDGNEASATAHIKLGTNDSIPNTVMTCFDLKKPLL